MELYVSKYNPMIAGSLELIKNIHQKVASNKVVGVQVRSSDQFRFPSQSRNLGLE